MFLGNIPLGSGLSSSAALSMSSGLALGRLYGAAIPPKDMAKMGQIAEHEFAGVKCGLLDQISSLFGKAHRLVLTDFRSIEVDTVPLGDQACFLLCDTKVKHNLAASEYNERRASCEKAAVFFADVLNHPVTRLRDVSWDEWERRHAAMDPVAAKRSAHVIGENTRVNEGCRLLRKGDLKTFGKLMFDSHESSRVRFENSCEELDFVVEAASRTRGVLGARLSGGGFGGSAVILADPADTDNIAASLADAYLRRFGHPCETRVVVPADGAALVPIR
jgi:galactokinase